MQATRPCLFTLSLFSFLFTCIPLVLLLLSFFQLLHYIKATRSWDKTTLVPIYQCFPSYSLAYSLFVLSLTTHQYATIVFIIPQVIKTERDHNVNINIIIPRNLTRSRPVNNNKGISDSPPLCISVRARCVSRSTHSVSHQTDMTSPHSHPPQWRGGWLGPINI